MPSAIRDAAGRVVQVGDIVGGVTSSPGQITIVGEVTEVWPTSVLVAVTTAAVPGKKEVPAVGAAVRLLARRMFLIHGRATQGQQVRAVSGPIAAFRWTGKQEDMAQVIEFVGEDLIGALVGDDGLTLLLRVNKRKPAPELVPPGWFILRPPGRGRHRACDPRHYAIAYAPIAPDPTT